MNLAFSNAYRLEKVEGIIFPLITYIHWWSSNPFLVKKSSLFFIGLDTSPTIFLELFYEDIFQKKCLIIERRFEED